MVNKYKVKPWIPAVVWMVFIFYLSSQPAVTSNELSQGVTKIIVEIIGKILPLNIEISTVNDVVAQLNHYVRKFAHFFAYLILGFLVLAALKKNEVQNPKAFVLSLLVCFLYASSDEIHQLFVLGRGCQFRDVMIDSGGAAFGIILYNISRKISIKKLKQ